MLKFKYRWGNDKILSQLFVLHQGLLQTIEADSLAGHTAIMQLSLSVRIAEEFHSKEEASMPLGDLARLAKRCGYGALCMRASQVGVHSPPEIVEAAADCLAEAGLAVSMVTGDFDTVYNNDNGPVALRNITPYLDLAKCLGAPRIRVALKQESDIANAQRAADEAAERDLQLVHQCHTLSLFETVEGIERTLTAINRPNFGLVYEPANLEICGQDYGPATIGRLAKWIFNVYLQNQLLKPDGALTLPTWCAGDLSFDLISVHTPGGVDFGRVFAGLKAIGYDETVTVHQSAQPGETPEESAGGTADFLRSLI